MCAAIDTTLCANSSDTVHTLALLVLVVFSPNAFSAAIRTTLLPLLR
jgi:hypothetical protein